MSQQLQSRSRKSGSTRGVAVRRTASTNNANVRRTLVNFAIQQRAVKNGKSSNKATWVFIRPT